MSDKKRITLQFRATEEEKRLIVQKAIESGMTLSEYIRRRCLEGGHNGKEKK